MSGVAAIFERSGAPAGEGRIAAMLGRLRRRGPDRGAYHTDGVVALAQAMLETTPEDAFDRQPHRAHTGARWIVADARVDNRRELLDLRVDAARPATEIPDAELILWAYERWGEACPTKLLGDFAFAIWDGERRRLFCARDRLGVRQLYYHHDAASFRCATEMDVLFADERVARRPDRRSIALYLAGRYTERDETLYEGVHALPPGHALTVTSTSIHREAYWRPDPRRATSTSGEDDDAARFRHVFSEAVRCRLRAGRPVAAHVSGGLDSSSVACEAERLRRAGLTEGAPLSLLRSAFPGLDCDELGYSQAVADHLGLPVATCSPADEPDICRLDQRYPDLYFHPTLTMLDPVHDDFQRRGGRVVLTGSGGDLLMEPTGFEVSYHLRRRRLGAAIEAAGFDGAALSWSALRKLAGQGLWLLAPRAAARVKKVSRPLNERWPWLSRESAEIVGAHQDQEWAELSGLHPDLLTADLCRSVTHLPLAGVFHDRAAALHGIEFRHPFYDVRVIEELLSLPLERRFGRGLTKRVIRRAMGPTLPSRVRERTDKADFGSYIVRVFLEGQRAALQRLFSASLLVERRLVDARALRTLIEAPPRAENALVIADLAAMELWLRDPVPRRLDTHSLAPHEDRHEHA
jgi:asparagine synthase (glutamine-hydrolysing)